MLNIGRALLFTVVVVSAAMATNKTDCAAPKLTSPLDFHQGHYKAGLKSIYKEGEGLFFRCNGNNYMVGIRWRRCLKGNWSGTAPRCIPKAQPDVKCRKIRYFQHGRVRGSRKVNSIVRFTCSRRYYLIGLKRLTCLKTGEWSGPRPKCLRDVSCPDPGTPVDGFRLGSLFKNGRTVQYSCKKDYKLVGSSFRRCRESGQWNGKLPKCIKLDPAQALKDVADNLKKNLVNKFNLVTIDSRARSGIVSGASGLDFVFVLDSSASVGQTNFKRGVEFVRTIINEFGVSTQPQGTRVAIVTFNSQAQVNFNLKTKVIKDKDQALKELGNIKFQGGGTNTAGALDKVFHVVSPETRKGANKVLFLITDGRSNAGSDPKHFAERLRQKNFEIYAIGITKNADKMELKSIASQPYRSHIHLLADYETLEKLKDMITGDGQDSWPECGLAGDISLRGTLKTPNRKTTKDDAWPWQAAIYADGPFKCGGALIADKWVLTSASCFDKKKIKDLTKYNVKVVLGEHHRLEVEGTEQDHTAIKIIRPRKYSKKERDDLVLVKLRDAIKQTAYVHSICYDDDTSGSLIWPTQYGVVTGWGSKTQNNIATIPANDELQQNVVKFVSERECQTKSSHKLKGNVFCGTSKDDTLAECLGDTGGPVMVKRQDDTWALVGVMKYNEGCPKDLKYSMFTKVGHYAQWITDTMMNN